MEPPAPPVEQLRDFRPPFCPRRDCPDHMRSRPGYRAHIHASYATRRERAVPRYRCLTCRRSFSRNAFSSAYYLKRPELLVPVAVGLVSGSAHRQIARAVGCAPSTVTRLSYRLGRHCLLLAEQAAGELASRPAEEPIVLDHFESFELTQDLPFAVATAVGRGSWFIHRLDPAPHRRSGPVTPAQRRRLARRKPRPLRGSYDGSTRRILDRLIGQTTGDRRDATTLHLISDDHPSYARTIRRHPDGERILHEVHPNPQRGPKGSRRSPEAIRRDRALFAVDLLHGLIRHSQAAHRRETIAFGRRLNALMLRLYVFIAWRNFIKRRSERRPEPVTPAMAVGLADRPWSWPETLARRRFPDRPPIDGIARELYELAWVTPELSANARHRLEFAY